MKNKDMIGGSLLQALRDIETYFNGAFVELDISCDPEDGHWSFIVRIHEHKLLGPRKFIDKLCQVHKALPSNLSNVFVFLYVHDEELYKLPESGTGGE